MFKNVCPKSGGFAHKIQKLIIQRVVFAEGVKEAVGPMFFTNHAGVFHVGKLPPDGINFLIHFTDNVTNMKYRSRVRKKERQYLYSNPGDNDVF